MWRKFYLSPDAPRPRPNYYTTENGSLFSLFDSDEDINDPVDFSSSSEDRSSQIQDSAAAPFGTILEVTSPNNSFEGDIVNFMTQVIDDLDQSVTSKTALLTEAGNLLDRIKRPNDAQEGFAQDFVTEITLPDITIESSGPRSGPSVSSAILTSASGNETRPTTSELSCPICFESLRGRTICATMCGHVFCDACIFTSLETSKQCPTCRKTVSAGSIHPDIDIAPTYR